MCVCVCLFVCAPGVCVALASSARLVRRHPGFARFTARVCVCVCVGFGLLKEREGK